MVCLNTLGQDREFTADQKVTALRTVQEFRDRWEALERENLANDVVARQDRLDSAINYRESNEAQDRGEMDRIVRDAIENVKEQEEPNRVALTPHEEGEMQMTTKLKAEFQTLTRCFHAPELVTQKSKDKSDNLKRVLSGDRPTSQVGSHGH